MLTIRILIERRKFEFVKKKKNISEVNFTVSAEAEKCPSATVKDIDMLTELKLGQTDITFVRNEVEIVSKK